MEKLTLQEKKFITEYIKTLDSENAVKKAGYKEKNLLKVAEKILSKDYIVKELNLQLKQRVNALNITKGYVVKKLLQIAEFSLEEEEITDKDGNFTGKKKLRDTSSALKAIDSLWKYLYGKPPEQEGSEAKIITISNLNDNKI